MRSATAGCGAPADLSRSLKQASSRTIVVVAAFLLPLLFLFPLEVYLRNTVEFVVGLVPHALFFGALTLVTGIPLVFLTRRFPGLFAPLLGSLSTVVFLEYSLFVPLARHRPFDGDLIRWEEYSTLAWLELGGILTVAMLFWMLRRKPRPIFLLSLFFLAFYGLGFLVTLSRGLGFPSGAVSLQEAVRAYFSDFHRLSARRNVIEIVADHTQGSLVHDILRSRPEHYSEVFDGFTLFVQASGRYPGTYPSIPYIMTGEAPELGFEVVPSVPFTHQYVTETLSSRSIVNSLARSGFEAYGFQVSLIYCQGDYAACIPGLIFSGRPVSAGLSQNILATASVLMDLSLFRAAPVPVRRFVYNDEQWFFRRLTPAEPTISGPIDVLIENMEIDDRPGSYNYFHHAGGHPPIQFDENCNLVSTRKWDLANTRAQVTCTLLQMELLVAALKENGIYDETMIILAGDHGSQWPTDLMGPNPGKVIPARVISSANPVLFVKPPNTRGELKFSFAPADLGDLPATIADAFGLHEEYPGIPLFSLGEEQERVRQYFWFLPTPEIFQNQSLPETTPYRIRGNLFQQLDWEDPSLSRLLEGRGEPALTELPEPDVRAAPSELVMNDARMAELTQGISALGAPGRPDRWVEGRYARVYLGTPEGTRFQLVLDSYLPPTVPNQSMTVLVNGIEVGQFGDEALRSGLRHSLPLPAEMSLKPVNVIEFLLSDAVSPPGDSRTLSIVLMKVALQAN